MDITISISFYVIISVSRPTEEQMQEQNADAARFFIQVNVIFYGQVMKMIFILLFFSISFEAAITLLNHREGQWRIT